MLSNITFLSAAAEAGSCFILNTSPWHLPVLKTLQIRDKNSAAALTWNPPHESPDHIMHLIIYATHQPPDHIIHLITSAT
jgi:hypothetical protein